MQLWQNVLNLKISFAMKSNTYSLVEIPTSSSSNNIRDSKIK